MQDMLVKLYDLDSGRAHGERAASAGIAIRRPLAAERGVIHGWVSQRFGAGWAGEVDAALIRTPATCFIGLRGTLLAGFACWDVAALGFFGPTGVDPADRGSGIGTALLYAALHAMRQQGYGYAIIGGVGPAAFYEKAVDAMPIANSNPGVFKGILSDSPGRDRSS